MITLSIESSCDETALALVKDADTILAQVVASQIAEHALYGGVVPEIASRAHAERIPFLLEQLTQESSLAWSEIDQIAFTAKPGLKGSLLVGQAMAETLAVLLNKKAIAVDHLHGHMAAAWLKQDQKKSWLKEQPQAPYLALVISGGHTHLFYGKKFGEFTCVAHTLDDAVGEAFDKVGRFLGLGYPAGPEIDRLAQKGNAAAVRFPEVVLKDGVPGFSFSGLKTAAIQLFPKVKQEISLEDFLASFQQALANQLTTQVAAILAQKSFPVSSLIVAGGVASNSVIRRQFQTLAERFDLKLFLPPLFLCTDNAAMIGAAAYLYSS